MDITYDDFIGVYRNVTPDGFCKHMIGEFNRLIAYGAGSRRDELNHIKSDHQIFLNLPANSISNFGDQDSLLLFYNYLQNCYNDYTKNFSILEEYNSHLNCSHAKAQRTGPGEGYHVWHFEQGPSVYNASRALVYMLYLNTLEDGEGGETEFFYQRKRFRPEENVMLIWPASFTHTHRGNIVLSNNYKYVITGWFSFN